MVIKWKEEYSCFDATIDAQHRKMIDMINKISEIAALKDGCDRYDEIVGVFNELKDYTVYHFGHEESLFDRHNYDSFHVKIQKLEHKSFIHKVSAMNLYDLDENQEESVQKVLVFLSKWLDHHILVVDREFGKFLKENEKQA